MTLIIMLSIGKDYSEFNKFGVFLGSREDLARVFPFLNEYDDLQIKELADRIAAKLKYYSVEDNKIESFCRDYGTTAEPIEKETFLRQTLFEVNQRNFIAPYCTTNSERTF